MGQRGRRRYRTAAESAEIWDRWPTLLEDLVV
jgi:hypothetical protein